MSGEEYGHDNQTKRLNFLKLIPGGNPTILVTAPPLPAGERMKTALRLMHPLHLQAEQVGFVNTEAAPPRLDMMGGEFCLNATRSLAFEAARRNRFLPLAGTEDLFGLVSCSGQPAALPVRVADGKRLLRLSRQEQAPLFELDCYVTMECGASQEDMRQVAPGAVLVRLPGICHLLLDENRHPQPTSPTSGLSQALEEEAAVWRKNLRLENEPASGVVWYKDFCPDKGPDGVKTMYYRITPLVHVAETRTSILESACGSASLALSLLTAAQAEPEREGWTLNLEIFQPSHERLLVRLQKVAGKPDAYRAEIGGPVWLCAEGEAYI
ncbi:MAG: hypothetical protein LBM64_02375 [Deltaproteobacteria bacterium]|jgi:hypothetical protein|nr:hypothetical protein [Deltaproteobacteria bacterium]